MAEFNQELRESIDFAAGILRNARYAVALTGAGVSVESGVRPFRGPDGVWTEYGEPPMDGYQRLLADPKREWQRWVNREGYIKGFFEAFEHAKPNPGHYAMAEMEQMGILKYTITQNVDGFHRDAGSHNVAEIHGNFWLLRCIECSRRYKQTEIEIDPERLPPKCPSCGGMVKSDGVYFGEPIPPDALRTCQEQVAKCDCMLLVGTSGFVYPAAGFPHAVKQTGGSLVEVDRYGTDLSHICNISLRGKSGEILPALAERLKAKKRRVG